MNLNFNLKKVFFNSKPQSVFFMVGGILMCGSILVGILTQVLQKNDPVTIGAFICGAVCLLFSIWILISRKKSVEAIDVNGWKYKLFMKQNKWLFILLAGCSKVMQIVIIMFGLHYFDFLSMDGTLNTREIVFVIVFAIFMVLLLGYIEYSKYKTLQFDEKE